MFDITLPIALNLFSAILLIIVLIIYPRKQQPLYRVDKVEWNDGYTSYYAMERKLFNRWKKLLIDDVQAYNTETDAKDALENYLCDTKQLEMTETTTVKEYGI